MIYRFEDIIDIHLEISSHCNAACPFCPRNFWGYPFNQGYVEHDMTLQEAKKIFDTDFLRQIKRILINGNFGDMVMNPHTVDICRYFKSINPKLRINISTNGGARDAAFWRSLAELKVEVHFCIDGLEDTHSIYRRNTVFSTVIKNARTFISAGGSAGWKMIKFEHNQHQIEQCRSMSKELAFDFFLLVDDGRDNGPVFNKQGELERVIGPSKWGSQLPRLDHMLQAHTDPDRKQDFANQRISSIPIKPITCEVGISKSLYISSTGDVFPCCYTGFSPRTYDNNSDVGYAMSQLCKIMQKNNALERPLRQCIEWFDQIEKSWHKPSFADGRLLVCNKTCGGPLKLDSFHVQQADYTDNRD